MELIRRFWQWLNTPNELRWGENTTWHLHADKPTLAKATQRALRRD